MVQTSFEHERKATEWIASWESEMANLGYPKARLSIVHTHGPQMLGYTWVIDLDNWVEAHTTNTKYMGPDQEAHDTAIQCFVACDYLRPRGIELAPAVLEMMGGNN